MYPEKLSYAVTVSHFLHLGGYFNTKKAIESFCFFFSGNRKPKELWNLEIKKKKKLYLLRGDGKSSTESTSLSFFPYMHHLFQNFKEPNYGKANIGYYCMRTSYLTVSVGKKFTYQLGMKGGPHRSYTWKLVQI